MDIIRCGVCDGLFEREDVIKIERVHTCYNCQKNCQNCNKPYEYGSDNYCYDCLECDLV